MNSFAQPNAVPTILLLVVLMGCTPQQNAQDLKEKTARATEDAKRDAKAVAAGIREGWHRDQPVNLNTATKEQWMRLPGMTPSEAERVIADRPYNQPDDLVTRHVLPKAKYHGIADRVSVKR
jgi:competence protein ComEA